MLAGADERGRNPQQDESKLVLVDPKPRFDIAVDRMVPRHRHDIIGIAKQRLAPLHPRRRRNAAIKIDTPEGVSDSLGSLAIVASEEAVDP